MSFPLPDAIGASHKAANIGLLPVLVLGVGGLRTVGARLDDDRELGAHVHGIHGDDAVSFGFVICRWGGGTGAAQNACLSTDPYVTRL